MSVTTDPTTYNNTINNSGNEDSNKNATVTQSFKSVSKSDAVIPLYMENSDPARPYYAKNAEKGMLDVLGTGTWCTNPPSSRDIIVPLTITEYQPEYTAFVSGLAQKLDQLSQLAKSDNLLDGFIENPIANSFLANKTNFKYRLPYLQLQSQDFSTSFGDAENQKSNILGKISSEIQSIISRRAGFQTGTKGFPGVLQNARSVALANAGLLLGDLGRAIYPAINAAKPQNKFYQGSSPVSYSLTFELSNTIDEKKSKWNKEFVELLAHNAGMGNLRNSIVGDSPCIYTLEIEGIRWCPACHINASYEGQGNLLVVGGETMPEAYTVTLEVSEIFPPLRFFYHEYLKNGNKVEAINSSLTNLCDIINNGIGAAGIAAGRFASGLGGLINS